MKRSKMSYGGSKRLFTATAMKTNKTNGRRSPALVMRGGIRL